MRTLERPKPNQRTNTDATGMRITLCRRCGSSDVVKYGICKGQQRYFCMSCQRKFADSNALLYKRFPVEQVGAALSMFYSGFSTREIGQNLTQQYQVPSPSKSTIYRWVAAYTSAALQCSPGVQAITGDA